MREIWPVPPDDAALLPLFSQIWSMGDASENRSLWGPHMSSSCSNGSASTQKRQGHTCTHENKASVSYSGAAIVFCLHPRRKPHQCLLTVNNTNSLNDLRLIRYFLCYTITEVANNNHLTACLEVSKSRFTFPLHYIYSTTVEQIRSERFRGSWLGNPGVSHVREGLVCSAIMWSATWTGPDNLLIACRGSLMIRLAESLEPQEKAAK